MVQHLKLRMRHYLYHIPKNAGYAATAKRRDITGHAQPSNKLVVCVYIGITFYHFILFISVLIIVHAMFAPIRLSTHDL